MTDSLDDLFELGEFHWDILFEEILWLIIKLVRHVKFALQTVFIDSIY